MQTILFDIETTAIGPEGQMPKRVHIFKAQCYETKRRYSFRENEMHKAVELLNKADLVVAHFGLGFDFRVLRDLYEYAPKEELDTLVLAYMFEGDIKEQYDYRRAEADKSLGTWKKNKFTGNLIGSQGLEAWGLRFGMPKGTYMKDMEGRGLKPWAEWNEEMDAYCDVDVDILVMLWDRLIKKGIMDARFRNAIDLEHEMQTLMTQLQTHGIYFNQELAHQVVDEVDGHYPKVNASIQRAFPAQIEPVKWVAVPQRREKTTIEKDIRQVQSSRKRIRPEVNTKQKKYLEAETKRNKYKNAVPRLVVPEGLERDYRMRCDRYFPIKRKMDQLNADLRKLKDELEQHTKDGKIKNHIASFPDREEVPPNVGAVTSYKRTTYQKATKTHITAGAEFCKVHLKELNPGSRVQVARRLRKWDHSGWQPTVWTDKGNAKVDADILGQLATMYPVTTPIAKFFLLKKRIGQISTGQKAWFKSVKSDGLIHPRIRPCATITHRATHSDPNMSQVPALLFGKNDAGDNVILKGEEGEWGYECRMMFGPPPASYTGGVQWVQVGTDLSGLELRCFGHYLFKYDNGEFLKGIGQVHDNNQRIMELANRTDAKRVIFALLYGAGNGKIGSIVFPYMDGRGQAKEGGIIRARLLAGLTGFAELTSEIQAKATYDRKLDIIDGREVPVRNAYAALNTLLQSTGSILAKQWIIQTINALELDHGLKIGYDGDFVVMLWSHDELQFACKPQLAELIAKVSEDCALEAGKVLNFKPLLEAESKIGKNWATCH